MQDIPLIPLLEMKSYDTFEYRAIIDEGTDDQICITGYTYHRWREITFVVLTFGLGFLFLKWYPQWLTKIASSLSPIASADLLLIKDTHGQKHVVWIHQNKSYLKAYQNLPTTDNNLEDGNYKYFLFKFYKYIWVNNSFKRLRGLDYGHTTMDLAAKISGLPQKERKDKLEIYGPNLIDVEVKSYFHLLIDEVLNPFYVFQVASIILWSLDNYYIYASCILLISTVSITTSLYETKKQRKILRDMVSHSNRVSVSVRCGDTFKDIPSCDLVPGDVIHIPPSGCIMPCDAILLTGTCIVNESMLTGESVPETKLAINKHHEESYSPETHKRNTLFCGTHVIQTRYYGNQKVLALVVRTGYSTTKGYLIRSIMFPPPLGFKFYKDSMWFVGILAIIATVGMVFSLYLYIKRGSSWKDTIVRCLDLITIVVPPALPAAMTIGTVYAQQRLKKENIYCISPQHINVAGKVKLVCFDKTGTLTEEGLDLSVVIPCLGKKFQSSISDPSASLNDKDPLKVAMATCHSLTRIDNNLTGDPLDLIMFGAINWHLEEAGPDSTRYEMIIPTVVRPIKNVNESPQLLEDGIDVPYEVGIIRQFPFSSSLQRMAVVCRTLGERHMTLYVKGAPEKIASLCKEDTIPDDFGSLLQDYTKNGYRVLALAYRKLPPKLSWHHLQKAKREELEENLEFLGLLVMQNMMKPETRPIIKMLQDANIRNVMVTGDNLLTALSVARDCEMVPPSDQVVILHVSPSTGNLEFEYMDDASPATNFHFAMEGRTFSSLRNQYPHVLTKFLTKSTIFARMSPDQKTQLVELFKDIGYVVAMCGDGANDCGALKAADVGISLSEAEASVAAPFTSKIPDISCVPKVIREGRCSLVTNFSMFKFIAIYSLIQFTSVLILYYVKTNLTDFMFLYIDIFIISTIAFLMGTGGPCSDLVAKRPSGSLINIHNLLSLIFHIIWMTATQIAVIVILYSQSWFQPKQTDDDVIQPSYENTSLFFFTTFQYLGTGIILSKGRPFRKPIYQSYFYALALLLIFCANVFLLFNPFPTLSSYIQLYPWPLTNYMSYRMHLVALICIYFVCAVLIEVCVPESYWLKKLSRALKSGPKNKYKVLQKEMDLAFRNNVLTLSSQNSSSNL